MLSSRVKAVRKIISRRQCTHALVTDPVDVEYISGFRASNAALLISPARLELFTDFRYGEAAREFCRFSKWKFTLIEESGFKYLKNKVSSGAVIGFQSDAVTIDRYRELKSALPRTKFVPLSSEIADTAVQKLDREIASMRTAARMGDKAFRTLLPHIKKSMTEFELARLLENICADCGSERPAFETIVLFGKRSALPHGRPGDSRLAEGDFVLMDFGCTVNGFRSDMTRTVVYGEPSGAQRNIYGAVAKAQSAARAAARAGIAGSVLDGYARGSIAASGFGEFFGHATGHGVGLRVHEKPRVSKNNETPLPENSVVTIEPGVYIPDVGGVRIEDMVALNKRGASLLTHSTRKLIELPL